MQRKDVENRIILACLTGSRAYGLANQNSDYDYTGVFIAPKDYYLGFKTIEQKDKGWDEPGNGSFPQFDDNPDTVIYELKKYLSLISTANPNILELLWHKPQDYLFLDDAGYILLKHREKFLSKKILGRFLGYADNQIRRIETHRGWILNPITEKPNFENYKVRKKLTRIQKAWYDVRKFIGLATESELYLSVPITYQDVQTFMEFLYTIIRNRIEYYEPIEEFRKILLEEIGFKAVLKNHPLPQDKIIQENVQKYTYCSTDYYSLLNATQRYLKDLKQYQSYQQWLKTRNPARAALEAKCGYDGKHAAHCIRLLKMCHEILTEGKVWVDRTGRDADALLQIRNGEVSYDQVLATTALWQVKCNDAAKTSELPKQVDTKFLNDLCVELVTNYDP